MEKIANELLNEVIAGAKKAFLLSNREGESSLHFGRRTVPNVDYMLWFSGEKGDWLFCSGDKNRRSFQLLFDDYGLDAKQLRFAVQTEEGIILSSDDEDVVGLISIHTSAEHECPLSILGLINHWGEEPSSMFLADRSTDLIDFSGCMAQTFQALMLRTADGE